MSDLTNELEHPEPHHSEPDHREAGGLDLTPRPVTAPASTSRQVIPKIIGLVVVAALGFVLFRTLGDAALFFYNADEAIERRVELEGERFRVQGTSFAEAQTVEIDVDGQQQVVVAFPMAFEGQVMDVVHTGSPAELFAPGVPVVLEGVWTRGYPAEIDPIDGSASDGWHFASNEMVVKHDNEYRPSDDRLTEAERGGYAPQP